MKVHYRAESPPVPDTAVTAPYSLLRNTAAQSVDYTSCMLGIFFGEMYSSMELHVFLTHHLGPSALCLFFFFLTNLSTGRHEIKVPNHCS